MVETVEQKMKRIYLLIIFNLVLCLFPKALASVNVTVNGSSYTIPQTNEKGWGTNVTNWIQAISSSTLQPTGGTFSLTNDVNFGNSFGPLAPYYKSASSNLASAGVLRLAVSDQVAWRNNANSANLALSIDASNNLLFNGNIIQTAGNANANDSTFYIYNNADNTKKLAFSAAGITTANTRTITMPDADVNLTAVPNTTLTGSRAIATTSGGVLTPATTTATELGYVSGVTSAIQTQINGKLTNPMTTTGDVIYSSNNSGAAARLGVGSTGQSLVVASGIPSWGKQLLLAATRSVTTTDSASSTADDVLILSGSSFTETLPNATGNAGKIFVLIHNGTSLSQKYTLATGGGNVCGIASGSYVLTTNLESLVVISDGANYQCPYHHTDTTSVAYTPTVSGGWTGQSAISFTWERHGHMMRVIGSFSATGSAATIGSVSLPSNTSIDTTGQLANTTAAAGPIVGFFHNGAGNSIGGPAVLALGTSTSVVYNTNPTTANTTTTPQTGSAGNCGIVNGTCSVTFDVPISDWQP
jgi:hypothetical protein